MTRYIRRILEFPIMVAVAVCAGVGTFIDAMLMWWEQP